MKRVKNIILECSPIYDDFEVAIVRPPKAFFSDLRSIFPASFANPQYELGSKMLCIPTMQHSRVDICKLGSSVEAEKDRLLKSFLSFSGILRKYLLEFDPNCWCDYIDPCSAFPVLETQSVSGYSEVDGLQVLLRFRTNQAGACKIVQHPKWGSRMYPATFFTNAAPETVLNVFKNITQNRNLTRYQKYNSK